MDFKTYFQETADQLNQELNSTLETWIKQVADINPKLTPLVKLFMESCQGGKRIRGILVRLGYEIGKARLEVEKDKLAQILKVAVAYEIFQTAILIHDDVIDESLLRRGNPTIFRSLGADHYAISQSIGLGDAGLFLAVKTINETNFSTEVKNKAIQFFTEVMIQTALGEILDVELSHGDTFREEGDVLTLHKLKTAQYTISGPLILGSILAGTENDLKGKLAKFGENLGIAFQLQDDILGVFGDEGEIGKSVTSDVEEGKNTLLITEALKNSNPQQKQFLEKYYGTGKISEAEFNQVKQLFIDTGSLDYSKTQAVDYVEKAKKMISEITKLDSFGKILEDLANYLVERRS